LGEEAGAEEECICRGDNVELVGEHVWLESGDFGFQPNATCAEVENVFANQFGCPDPRELRELCCIDYNRPKYVCSNAVRDAILSGYDKVSTPVVSALHEGVNVTVKVEYQAVTDIDIGAGTAEIFVWLTMSWRDPRLAWTYDPNTTCTTFPITVRASMKVSDSDIWVPDLDLLNKISGARDMGSSWLAVVYPDGSVVWQRDGKLKAGCNMKNLGNMPFDELGCQFMFGSLTYQNNLGVNYMLDPNGALVVGEFSSPYAEYALVRAQPGVFEETGLRFLFFDFYFARGTSYYLQATILPVIIFSLLSICSITLGFTSQQRIALNLTLLLVAVAQKIAMSSLLPVTDHKLWLVDFVTYSFFWNAATLFENIFVGTVASVRKAHDELKEPELDQEMMPEESKSFFPAWFYTFSLRRFDMVCFALSFISYVVFITIMLAYRGFWGSDVSSEFLWSNNTSTS